MWSARRPPARVSGPAARTNDIDTDERRQIIPQRGRPTTNHQQGVDKRCLMTTSVPKDHEQLAGADLERAPPRAV